MGFLRKVGTILGFHKSEPHDRHHHDDDDGSGHRTTESRPSRPTRGGFSFQVPIASSSEKPFVGPVVVPCGPGEGGVQGFSWYGRRLRIDEDGDVADEFLDEVLPPDNSGAQQEVALHRFEIKYRTRPAPVRKQIIAINGNIHPGMEYQGMLRWV